MARCAYFRLPSLVRIFGHLANSGQFGNGQFGSAQTCFSVGVLLVWLWSGAWGVYTSVAALRFVQRGSFAASRRPFYCSD